MSRQARSYSWTGACSLATWRSASWCRLPACRPRNSRYACACVLCCKWSHLGDWFCCARWGEVICQWLLGAECHKQSQHSRCSVCTMASWRSISWTVSVWSMSLCCVCSLLMALYFSCICCLSSFSFSLVFSNASPSPSLYHLHTLTLSISLSLSRHLRALRQSQHDAGDGRQASVSEGISVTFSLTRFKAIKNTSYCLVVSNAFIVQQYHALCVC